MELNMFQKCCLVDVFISWIVSLEYIEVNLICGEPNKYCVIPYANNGITITW